LARGLFESELKDSTLQRNKGKREEVEQLRRRLRDIEAESSLLVQAAALFARLQLCAPSPHARVSEVPSSVQMHRLTP
jgi:hypothetical protein